MTLKRLLATGICGAIAITSAGCGDSGSEGTNSADGATAVMTDWDACDVIDVMRLAEFMEYDELTTPDGQPASSGHNQGMDAPAIECVAPAVFTTFSTPTGREVVGDGEIAVGVIPWADEQTAVDDLRERIEQRQESVDASDNVEVHRNDEFAGAWDEGFFVHYSTDARDYLTIWTRDDDFILQLKLNFPPDPGLQYHETAGLDDDSEDWRQFSWDTEELVTFLTETYVPEVRESVLREMEA